MRDKIEIGQLRKFSISEDHKQYCLIAKIDERMGSAKVYWTNEMGWLRTQSLNFLLKDTKKVGK
jgi:hypothetical protein